MLTIVNLVKNFVDFYTYTIFS